METIFFIFSEKSLNCVSVLYKCALLRGVFLLREKMSGNEQCLLRKFKKCFIYYYC